ncbi:MAG: hypothetical protein U1G07_09490 [Verrucomicrobiota bacterium]
MLAALLGVALLLNACGSGQNPDPTAVALTQEKQRLETENQELGQMRADNEEVKRLKQENQDLPKLRSQYQEANRLRKENDQFRQQVAKLAPAGATNLTAAVADVHAATQLAQQDSADKSNDAAAAEGAINDGDNILIEPKHLKQILPDFDWDKSERTQARGVRALLEQRDGVRITNISQLIEAGITNFVIQRAPATSAVEVATPPR